MDINEVPHFCPHCGYNLKADPVWEGDGFTLLPLQSLYNGEDLNLSPSEAGILYTIAAAKGRYVTSEVLLERIGSEGGANNISVLIHRLKKKLPFDPFYKRLGAQSKGYLWKGAPSEQ